ncbi:unnamed protein product [Rhodiola kirilowii]
MFPNEHMSSYYDPRTGVMNPWADSHGCYPNPMPCCSHGYNNCYYAPPPGPATPYTHIYPPQPYVSSPPVPPHYHHHYPQPVPCAFVNSYPPSDGCLPLQHQQQHPAWRPVIVPQSNCCCGCPNHNSYYQGNQISSSHNDSKVIKQQKEEPQPEDATRAGSIRPFAWNNGNNSSQSHLFWIPPQYVNNQQQQNVDKGPQDWNMAGQLIPFDLDKFASLQDNDGNKPMAAGIRNNFPFPFILMPQNTSSSGNTTKDRIKEIEEKSSSCNSSKPLKLLVDDDVTAPHESVKSTEPPTDTISKGVQLRNEKVKVKDIPVKHAGENDEKKPSTNAAIESRSRSASPAKTSKLPPVCLRVDPLPRKKTGNGTPKSPSHQRNLQQLVNTSKNKENTVQSSPQNGSKTEDVNVTKKDEREEKIHQHSIGQEKNVKVLDPKESPKNNVVASFDEDGKVKQGRETAGEGESVDSVKPSKEGKSLSEEAAAVRIQSAYRGYEERKWQSLQKLRQIAKVREQISGIKDRIQALETDPDGHKGEIERQRLMIGETVMSLLLTLDTIQGLHWSIRDVRKSVAKELISLQEKLDSFHGQRSRESEDGMEHGTGDMANINEVSKDRSRTEKEDMNDMGNASSQEENKHEESDRENMSAHDEKVDKEHNVENTSENVDNVNVENTVEKVDKEQTLENTSEKGNNEVNLENTVEKVDKEVNVENTLGILDKEMNVENIVEKVDEEENLENTVDYTCAEVCQDVPVGCAHAEQSEGVTRSGANAQKQDNDKLPPMVGDHNEDGQFDEHLKSSARVTKDPAILNSSDLRVNGTDGYNKDERVIKVREEVDLKLKTTADEAEGSVEENTEVITLDERPSEAGSNWYTASDVSKNETTVNGEVGSLDLQTTETNQMLPEGEELNQCSCTATIENGEVVSGKVSKADNESVLEVCGDTLEHVHNHMENQVDRNDMGPLKGNSCERDTTIISTCPLAAILPEMEEYDMVNKDAQDVMTLHDSAGLSKAARAVVEQPADQKLLIPSIDKNSNDFGEGASDIESEQSVVTDNSSKADKTLPELCDKGLEKSNTDVDDATPTPGADEGPYSSQASWPSSKAAGDLTLAEENEKLRETVRKLLESEKDQLSVISTLNGRLKNLEKKVMKKGKRKLKIWETLIADELYADLNSCHQYHYLKKTSPSLNVCTNLEHLPVFIFCQDSKRLAKEFWHSSVYIQMGGTRGEKLEAQIVQPIRTIPERSTTTAGPFTDNIEWGLACNGHLQEAIALYAQMRTQLVKPNNFNIPFALKACGNLKCISEGEQIHADLLKEGFISDVYVQTSLLDMYVKCGRVAMAKQVFDRMVEKTIVSWTAMLAGYCSVGLLDQAKDLFREMPTKNVVTWNVMIDGLCRFGNIAEARRYFDMMPVKNVVSWTTMISGYSRRQDVVNARLLFDKVVEKEVIAWTAMISCYVENGDPDEAIEIFREMQAAGVKADEVTFLTVISAVTETGSSNLCEWIHNCIKATHYGSKLKINNALLNMHASVGSVNKALKVFHEMSKRDVVSYNSIITGCASHGFADQALTLFSMMLNAGIRPNGITFTAVLTACAHSGLVEEGRKNFALMRKLGFIKPKVKHYSCMVDLLGRAGLIDEAYNLITSMPLEPEASIWGALLGACKIHGNLQVAEIAANKLFEMESRNPGNFCVLANIYSENKMWIEASKLRGMMMGEGVCKMAGRSLVEA